MKFTGKDRPELDAVTLTGIACRTRIGVPDRERKSPQRILIDLTFGLDLRKAGLSDDVRDTVDYAALERGVRAMAERGEFRLLESLAASAARFTLGFDRRIRSVRVAVRKRPKLMPRTREVSVELVRSRGSRLDI